jgi:multidrug efflux pump subunit AcrA (membrane-fusion protein)
VKVARERQAQAQAMLKYAQTGPQQVAAQSARAKQALAQVQQAQAQLDQAKLNLSYTKIVAPAAGIITRKSVEIDQNVAAGQNLLTLVSLEDLWVTANFKETQLRHMSAGQPVEIEVDATGKTYQRQGDADRRRHRLGAFAVPAGERDRQLREGGAARSGAGRLSPISWRRPQPLAAAGAVSRAQGAGEAVRQLSVDSYQLTVVSPRP